jgi:K+ transporter
VLATLSAFFWAVLVIVSLKYVWVVLRFDNEGEGGVLALTARAHRDAPTPLWAKLAVGRASLPLHCSTATPSSRRPSRCCRRWRA